MRRRLRRGRCRWRQHPYQYRPSRCRRSLSRRRLSPRLTRRRLRPCRSRCSSGMKRLWAKWTRSARWRPLETKWRLLSRGKLGAAGGLRQRRGGGVRRRFGRRLGRDGLWRDGLRSGRGRRLRRWFRSRLWGRRGRGGRGRGRRRSLRENDLAGRGRLDRLGRRRGFHDRLRARLSTAGSSVAASGRLRNWTLASPRRLHPAT